MPFNYLISNIATVIQAQKIYWTSIVKAGEDTKNCVLITSPVKIRRTIEENKQLATP